MTLEKAKKNLLKPQVGFTLIEALVAVVVLAIGLLGVAALQIKALQSAHVSYQRSIATIAAQDITERLWVEIGNNSGECPVSTPLQDLVDIWEADWDIHFNTLDVTLVDISNCEYKISIGWVDERFFFKDPDDPSVTFNEDVSNLVYAIKLPGK